MASVVDVAAYILDSMNKRVTTMKLQKLLYYCQGWHLAWEAEKLYDAEIQAWANGPVVREIYDLHRGRYTVEPPWPDKGDPTALHEDESTTVDAVLEAYGDWTPEQLSQTTHREPPWREARKGLPATARSIRTIDTDIMQDYFIGLLEAQSTDDEDDDWL